MKIGLIDRVREDLKESRITSGVALSFIPIAFATYLFHEFGHWFFGEILGNDMILSLNLAYPRNGYFIKESHRLWSSIGGPLFTIIQSLIFLRLTIRTKSAYAFSFVFYAGFSRFFSIVFGGIDKQDESAIASMTNSNKYLIASLVLILLFIFIRWAVRVLNLNSKAIGYYIVLSVLSTMLVISVDNWFLTN